LSQALLRISDYRFGHRIESRAEAARRLLMKGLEAEAAKTEAA
jgi:hypothetical protein